jgi:hypothetical protein
MQETGEDFGGQDEDTEIQNLPLYTERKADGSIDTEGVCQKTSWSVSGKGTCTAI